MIRNLHVCKAVLVEVIAEVLGGGVTRTSAVGQGIRDRVEITTGEGILVEGTIFHIIRMNNKMATLSITLIRPGGSSGITNALVAEVLTINFKLKEGTNIPIVANLMNTGIFMITGRKTWDEGVVLMREDRILISEEGGNFIAEAREEMVHIHDDGGVEVIC